MYHSLTLAEIHRIKRWHVEHRDQHPLEYQLWDAVLCLWLMGWIGWLPVFVLDVDWAWPLCLLAMSAPRLYVAWRRHAHRLRRLRCDWLCDLDSVQLGP
jgi:hypothetical protein